MLSGFVDFVKKLREVVTDYARGLWPLCGIAPLQTHVGSASEDRTFTTQVLLQAVVGRKTCSYFYSAISAAAVTVCFLLFISRTL